MKRLIIIGCGPKALAIASKAYVLKKMGNEVPEVVIIEKYGPGANWNGKNGYTDGELTLGTSPMEDMGFPYASEIHAAVDKEMQKLSWFAYLIEIDQYVEWINRSLQPPKHKILADYFKWVLQKIKTPIIIGEAIAITVKENKWEITYKNGLDKKKIESDGLVITGPGDPHAFPITTDSNAYKEDHIFNGQNVWHHMKKFKDIQKVKIAVIGGGETAAGVVTGLLRFIDDSSQIEIITRHPMLFTRNQNWMEIMYFSKALKWPELSEKEKTEIIKHADRGTFSPQVKNLLDSVYNVNLGMGQAKRIEISKDEAYLITERNNKEQKIRYDYIIEATGFNPLSFTKLLDSSLLKSNRFLPEMIDKDLSVIGLSPKLHIPGMAALAQGPGFCNLSCLGLLSERVLSAYINFK